MTLHGQSLLLPLLVLLGQICWRDALKAKCPAGYYRDSAIVWNCSGDFDTVYFLLEEDVKVGVLILTGVIDFKGNATANLDVDLQLYDEVAKVFPLRFQDGVVNDEQRTGTYNGLQITYSGDMKGTVPCQEAIQTTGSVPSTLALYFHNEFNKVGMTKLDFRYSGVNPCPANPLGCSVYVESTTRKDVEVWSRWVQSEYATAVEAWEALTKVKTDSNAHWYIWRSVWSKRLGAGETDKTWKACFYFLDVNHDMVITLDEFIVGYELYQWSSGEVDDSITAWREWLCVNYGYDRDMAWDVFSNEGTSISRSDWADYVWKDWFTSWSDDLKVPANVSFDFLDSDKNMQLTKTEFLTGYSADLCVSTTLGPSAGTGGSSGSSGSSQSSQSAQSSQSSASASSGQAGTVQNSNPASGSSGASHSAVSSSAPAAGGAGSASPSAGSAGTSASAGNSASVPQQSSAGSAEAGATSGLFSDPSSGLLLGALASGLCCLLPLALLLCWSRPWKRKSSTKRSAHISSARQDSFMQTDTAQETSSVSASTNLAQSASSTHWAQSNYGTEPARRTVSQQVPMPAPAPAPAPAPWWNFWTAYPAQTQFKYMALPAVEVPLPGARETKASMVTTWPTPVQSSYLLPPAQSATTVTRPLLVGAQPAKVTTASPNSVQRLARSGQSFHTSAVPVTTQRYETASPPTESGQFVRADWIRNLPVLQVTPGSPLAGILGRLLRQSSPAQQVQVLQPATEWADDEINLKA